MKNKIVFILGVLFAANAGYSEVPYCPVPNKDSGYIHNGQLVPKCTENDSPEIWSGSWEDLQAVAKRVKEKFSFETTKHKSRDVASLKPASKQEMEKHISNGNYQEWNEYIFDSYHESPNVVDALKTEIRKIIPVGMVPMLDVPILLNDVMKVIGGKVVKYTTHRGDEVVYSKADGRIILDEQLGTRNFGDNYDYLGSELFTKFTKQSVNEIIMNNVQLSSLQPLSPLLSKKLNRVIQLVMEFPTHKERDMDPHENDNQYKYAGILFESGSDGRFYIVDGQTGKRMTKKQVEDFPTTFSDMWKDKGLVCVESDAVDIVSPKENRQSAQNASSEDDNDAGKDETLPVIDTTKLEGLLQNRISFLSRLVAVGRKITEEENRKENSLLDSVMTELASLVEIISLANVSDDKKIKMLDDIANRCMPYVEKINGLLREAEARGIATIKTGNLSAKLQENVRKIRNSTGKISND